LTGINSDAGKKVIRALSDFRRNDVIRVVALVALVAFPLMAYAQLGSAAKAMKPPNDAALASAEPVTPAKAVAADSCANQHWPFFSAECLRGSTEPVRPRLVSMSVEDTAAAEPPKPPATAHLRHVVRPAGGHDGASTRSRKPAKPRVAHTRERRPLTLSYAASAAAPVAMPGW
jgi:hypothetical protein